MVKQADHAPAEHLAVLYARSPAQYVTAGVARAWPKRAGISATFIDITVCQSLDHADASESWSTGLHGAIMYLQQQYPRHLEMDGTK
mmetsp:Transcript_103971/g.303521  ORF Transcript_103971/g.303521 Transcript_103971/m.303521 type:complete len:87 (-) Transcript_103971:243-503(-)